MFPQIPRTGLTLPKILTGINKTLNVANQVIPIYVQAKPMVENAKNAFKVAQQFLTNSKPNNQTKKTNPPKNTQTNQPSKNISNPSNPTFFI